MTGNKISHSLKYSSSSPVIFQPKIKESRKAILAFLQHHQITFNNQTLIRFFVIGYILRGRFGKSGTSTGLQRLIEVYASVKTKIERIPASV